MSIPQDPIQFLTLEEARAIDGAMLSMMEKFMTRITISSLRIIAKIAQGLSVHAEELSPQQIVQWIEHDSQVRQEQGEDAAFLKWTSPHPDLDFEDTRQDEVTPAKLSSHEKFLTRMVISAMQALGAIAKDYSIHLEELSAEQIIAWVERDAKVKREQGLEAAFLSW
ncbi:MULTISPECIES: hypothetical protein [Pseudanabaena]|uniref:Uncharacterized protein n=2 Tax=Pseudanabaena TaxID=1152 RepID=L8N053_9CYAN|nr:MULTISPECIES: hypothetical protein [Pseudanabaena]ELS31628.1 hypothetical protein Pse7429DRAFT_3135 [Pseudanabaena biceps PCC 7429]MDG3496121.1 hypothetical protein [Pseudanabaena catenata USMAC16]